MLNWIYFLRNRSSFLRYFYTFLENAFNFVFIDSIHLLFIMFKEIFRMHPRAGAGDWKQLLLYKDPVGSSNQGLWNQKSWARSET